MRILFALAYSPGLTRIRSRMILERLCSRHDVTIVGLAWDELDRRTFAEWRTRAAAVHVIPHGRARQLLGLVGNPVRPFQEMVSTSPAFARRIRRLIADANTSGQPFDALHIEHFRGAVAADLYRGLEVPVVFDAVDCLAALAEQAQDFGISRMVRLVAGAERWRTQHAEDRLLQQADVVSVVAERDRQAMVRNRTTEKVVVIPNGVERHAAGPGQLTEAPRAIFTGKLSYHANQAALRWLLEEVWPGVRRLMPSAELTIAGADPPDWIRRASRGSGTILVANPPDMHTVLNTARVAVAPVVYSVGIQNKILEAMAAGLPVVATRSAVSGLGHASPPGVICADTPGQFAAEIVRLFRDNNYAELLRREGYQHIVKHHDWDAVVREFELLYAPAALSAKVA